MQQHKTTTDSNPISDLIQRAVSHARAGQWDEAVKANRDIIARSPNDVEGHNRLGKALCELGKIKEAMTAFQRALDLQSGNVIASRNLERLRHLEGTPAAVTRVVGTPKVNPATFMTARGSSVVTALRKPAPGKVLASVSAGDRLAVEARLLDVQISTPPGEYLGMLDARIGRRIARLSAGGNRYEATVAGFADQSISVLVREVYRSPKQAHITSFPPALQQSSEAYEPADNGDVRPDVFLDRRSMRREIAEEFEEEDGPQAKQSVASLVGIGAELEEVVGIPFDDR